MRRAVCFLCITLISSLATYAQTLPETVAFGQTLQQQKNFDQAVATYKRVLFFDSAGTYQPTVYYHLANCLYETQQFSEAADYYELAYFVSSDSLKPIIQLRKASCFLIERSYLQAKEELLTLPDALTAEQRQERDNLTAMLSFALEDYAAAEQQFKQIATDTAAVHRIFRKNERVSRINPKTAKRLSMILPGLGQFYAGDIKNGVNSLLLTTGLVALGVRVSITQGILDAGLSIVPWIQRYYMGGFQKAEQIALQRKQDRRREIFKEILTILETHKKNSP